MKRRVIVLGVLLLLALVAVLPAKAFEGRGGDAVTIPAGEVIDDDLYVTAGRFVLEGTVRGDLIVFAGEITILSKIVVSYLGGRLILERTNPALAENRVWPLVLGIVIFAILAAIPLLGGLVSLVVVLFGLGALWIWTARAMRREPLPAAGSD